MKYRTVFKRQCLRELYLQGRSFRSILNASLFFLMVLIFFPLAVPAQRHLVHELVPALVWIATLFALLMSAERLFQQDMDDGVLEQWLISGYPMSLLLSAKLLVHWLSIIIPILLLCPCIALLFSLNSYELGVLMLTLILGTPSIMLLCALSAAFATPLEQKGVLMGLILFPLTIPVLVFGAGTLTTAMQGGAVRGDLALLAAIALIAAVFLPFVIATVLRIAVID